MIAENGKDLRSNYENMLNMDDIKEKVNVLRRSEIFLGLSNETLKNIVAEVTCHTKTYEANEVIFNAGDYAENLIVVEYGEVTLIVSHPLPDLHSEAKAEVDTVCAGGTFGWSSLIAPHTYTIGAICKEPAKVLALNGRELLKLLDRETKIGYEVMKALNRIIGLRLRDSNRALIKIIARNKATS